MHYSFKILSVSSDAILLSQLYVAPSNLTDYYLRFRFRFSFLQMTTNFELVLIIIISRHSNLNFACQFVIH